MSDIDCIMFLMSIWRCWHIRNEIVHDKQTPLVDASRCFLRNYLESLLGLARQPAMILLKKNYDFV